MLIFHASPFEITRPDTLHSRDNLDFGKGFYATALEDQARMYSERFTLRGRQAFVNKYEFALPADARVKEFPRYDEEWLDFVLACRQGERVYEQYDIVIGGIANDRIFNTIDLYTSGEISKGEALKRLVYEQPNQQMCFLTQSVIDSSVRFISAEKISPSEV